MKLPLIISIVGLMLIANLREAPAQDISKYEAIFTIKFVDYIEWPGGNIAVTIGVFGASQVHDEIADVLTKKGSAHKIKKIGSLSEIDECDIVFVPESEAKNFDNIVASARGKNILIISQDKDLIKRGAGISFYVEDSKLKFAINKEALTAESLKVSNTLLALGQAI